jgi:hypothetical protein
MSLAQKVGAAASAIGGAAALVAMLRGAAPSAPAASSASVPTLADGGIDWDAEAVAIAASAASAADAASHFQDPDPILIAAPFEVTNTATQAFAQLIPSPQAVVFQPGGTRAGNVYTTVAQLDAVAQTITGPFDLVCDTTYAASCTLSGALTLSKWATWTCTVPFSSSAATGPWKIAAGTTIVNPPREIDCGVVSAATAAVTSLTAPMTMIVNAELKRSAGSQPIWSSTAAMTIHAESTTANITNSVIFKSTSSITVFVGNNSNSFASGFSSPTLSFVYQGPNVAGGPFASDVAIAYGNIPPNPLASPGAVNNTSTPPLQTWNSVDATGAAQAIELPAFTGTSGFQVGIADVGSNSTANGITVFVSDDGGNTQWIVNPVTGAAGLSYTYTKNGESHLWTMLPPNATQVDAGILAVWVAADSLAASVVTGDGGGVQSVTAGNATVTIGGTTANPTVTVNVPDVLDGAVQSVTAANSTITIGGTAQSPTVAVNVGAVLDGSAGGSVTWAGDLAGSSSSDQYVAAISGNGAHGGQIPINATQLTWAANQNPGLEQSTPTLDTSTSTMLIQAQAPYASATTNKGAGSIALNTPAPVTGGAHGAIELEDTGAVWSSFLNTGTVAEWVWASSAPAPTIVQSAATSDVQPQNFTLTPQAAYASASVHTQPGAIVLNEPAPVSSSTPGYVTFAQGGVPYMGVGQATPTAPVIVFYADAGGPEIAQYPQSVGNGSTLLVQSQSTSAPGASAGTLEIFGGNAVGDGGVGGGIVLQTGTGTLTPDGGQGGSGQFILDVGSRAYAQFQGNLTDFVAMGDAVANLPSVGLFRVPAAPSSSLPVMTFGNYNGNLLSIQYNEVILAANGIPTQVQGSTVRVAANYGASFLDVIGGGMNWYDLSTIDVYGATAWVQQTAAADYRFVPGSGGGATRFSGAVLGDPTTSSPLEMGVSSPISIAGTGTVNITLTSSQYTNQDIQFSGTPSALSQVHIILPTIAGGASGYCVMLDFTQATMTGWTGGMIFYIGSTSGPGVSPSNSARQGAYEFCYDSATTTPRIFFMPTG